ncbi:EamA family transporter [Ferrovum sp.]|uniref:DMT family transporter n=1 Tax=Ferrovum sp. TaxID=2609467 RepID=UPI002614227C|nr:EamA family transporter [Ferrovum sp.]
MRHSRGWGPLLGLVVLSLTWGYSWVAAKEGLGFAGPLHFAAQRSVLGGLALLALLPLTGRPWRWQFPRETLTIGLIQVSGFMLFQTWALVTGGPGKTAVLIFTMPVWTLLLSGLVLREPVRGAQWVAAVLTLGGLLLIIEPWEMHTSLVSKCLGLLAAFCWAVGTLLVKRLRQRHEVDLLNLTAWQMALGALPLVGAAVLIPERATHWTWTYGAILAFMALASTALCWWLWLYILDRVPAWEASLSVLGTPVVAILSSRWMTGESFHRSEVGGILLIGSGLAFLAFIGWLNGRRAGRSAPVGGADEAIRSQRTG